MNDTGIDGVKVATPKPMTQGLDSSTKVLETKSGTKDQGYLSYDL